MIREKTFHHAVHPYLSTNSKGVEAAVINCGAALISPNTRSATAKAQLLFLFRAGERACVAGTEIHGANYVHYVH